MIDNSEYYGLTDGRTDGIVVAISIEPALMNECDAR